MQVHPPIIHVKDVPPLTLAEAQARLNEVPGWRVRDDGKALVRDYSFRNYAEAYAFVARVSELAEQKHHHPDIRFGWGYAEIAFSTHSIGGLHANDFIMATLVNAL